MFIPRLVSLGPLLLAIPILASTITSLPTNAQSLLNESLTWMDHFYDPSAGYLFDLSSSAALRHETRSSAWYAIGLLARNEGSDVDGACRIIRNVIEGQYKDPRDQWYGDYQKYPEEPMVGTVAYPESIYNSWDPNWRGFVGTTLIVGLEEFEHLLPDDLVTLIEESLYNATAGDSYRVGGVDGDNLYPAYTNPSLMRAFTSGWTGRRLNNRNMTTSGETYANEILALFDRSNTLSEFNSGTYTGVSLYALTLWAKYLPEESVMKKNAARMIQYTWEAIGELWHPDLKNVAGPWDRSYGFDMNRYLSLLSLWLWTMIGKENSSVTEKTPTMSHSADFAYAPLFAILCPTHNALVPETVYKKLATFQGKHTFNSSTFSPPFDIYPRNITAWLATNISIGAETFNETVIGGPAINPKTFNPAVIQWRTSQGVGFISLYPTEKAVTAVASEGRLNLTYPIGTDSSIFSFIVSPFPKYRRDVSDWNDVFGLDVAISGNVNLTLSVSFAGSHGGANPTINDFEFWNFTYSMPTGSVEVPHLLLELTLE